MSTTQFNPANWTYVADPMGRMGQGYYKNRSNPSQTITAQEFERRRTATPVSSEKNDEQNINIKNESSQENTQPSAVSQLTPWDNPVIGEQVVEKEIPAQQRKPVLPAVSEAEKKRRKEEEERKKQEAANQQRSGGETTGRSAGVSGMESSSNSEKVVCTELVKQGLMSESNRRACTLYAHSRLPSSFMNGYHFWAVPYVRFMRKSKFATRFIVPFVNHRTQEVVHRLNKKKQGSWLGKIICTVHDPLCSWLGKYVKSADYHTLYSPQP